MVERHCGGSTLKAVGDLEAGGGPRTGQYDDIVLCEGIGPGDLASALVGRKLVAVRRKGKQLWFEMGGSANKYKAVLFHFGMTGAFVVKGHAALKYQEFKVRDEQWPPKFCKLELTFANGARLAFADPRRLGRIRLRTEPLTQPPISLLAPDPLTSAEGPDLDIFKAALRATAAPIKATLLDQERAVCGVGNWVADDALYLAKVHPQAVSNKLGDDQVVALLAAVRTVCRVACEVSADSERFPKNWLFHARWGRESKPGTSRTLPDGRRVSFSTVAGRTTATVPAEQGRAPSYGEQLESVSRAHNNTSPQASKRRKPDTEVASSTSRRRKVKSQKSITQNSGVPTRKKAEVEWAAAEAAWNALEMKLETDHGRGDSSPTASPKVQGDAANDRALITKIRTEILRIAEQRGSTKTLCPSEVPRKLFSAAEWRSKMDLVRSVGLSLAKERKIVVMQKGNILRNPADARGPIRYRISSG
eukprot:COSAG02_NODE_4266_length_5569_cov_14.425594_4_plen_476_part_00